MSSDKRVVYSCIIGGYDVAFPPLNADRDVDYVLITDDPDLKVAGWTIKHVARDTALSESAQNRWYKVFPHKVFPEHRSSLYIDGNLRPVKSLKRWLKQVEDNPCDMMVRCHAVRSFVHEEVEACIAKGKVSDPEVIRREYADLLADGFEDRGELTTNNVLVRDHSSPEMREAMEIWWHYISTYAGRDQISLAHALRTSGTRRAHMPRLSDPPMRCLQTYPHFGKSQKRLFNLKARARARAPESKLHALADRVLKRL